MATAAETAFNNAVVAYQAQIDKSVPAIEAHVKNCVDTAVGQINSYNVVPGYNPAFENDIAQIVSSFNNCVAYDQLSKVFQPYVNTANTNFTAAAQKYASSSSPSQSFINAKYAAVNDILNTLVNTTIPGIVNQYVPQVNAAVESAVARVSEARLTALKSDLDRFLSDTKNKISTYISSLLSVDNTPNLPSLVESAKSEMSNAIDYVQNQFQSVDTSQFSMFDTVDRRSKINKIVSDMLDYLNSRIREARQPIYDFKSYIFPLYSSNVNQFLSEFNDNISSLTMYNQDMVDYTSDFISNVDSEIKSVTSAFDSHLESADSEIASAESEARSKFIQYRDALYSRFPRLRFTGGFVLPDQVDWSGPNQFCVEVLNDDDIPVTLWFGWKFKSSRKSYTYNVQPQDLCTINPHESSMCCTSVPFDEVFSDEDPANLGSEEYYIYIIPHLVGL